MTDFVADFQFEKIQPIQATFSMPVVKEGGVTDHQALTGRDKADQHTIGAITGLEERLTQADENIIALHSDVEELKSSNPSVGGNDYEKATNKPSINGVTLSGNKTLDELGIQSKGNYANSDSIPTKVSQLENDSGYLKEHQSLADVNAKIESNTSAITKVEGDVSKVSGDLTTFKTTVYTKTETDDLIANIDSGSTVDLTDYAKKTDVDTKVTEHNSSAQAHSDIRTQVTDFETKLNGAVGDITALQELVNGLQERIAALEAKKTVVSENVSTISSMTQAEYDALETKDEKTLYLTGE